LFKLGSGRNYLLGHGNHFLLNIEGKATIFSMMTFAYRSFILFYVIEMKGFTLRLNIEQCATFPLVGTYNMMHVGGVGISQYIAVGWTA
jgi:hypothetical protein